MGNGLECIKGLNKVLFVNLSTVLLVLGSRFVRLRGKINGYVIIREGKLVLNLDVGAFWLVIKSLIVYYMLLIILSIVNHYASSKIRQRFHLVACDI